MILTHLLKVWPIWTTLNCQWCDFFCWTCSLYLCLVIGTVFCLHQFDSCSLIHVSILLPQFLPTPGFLQLRYQSNMYKSEQAMAGLSSACFIWEWMALHWLPEHSLLHSFEGLMVQSRRYSVLQLWGACNLDLVCVYGNCFMSEVYMWSRRCMNWSGWTQTLTVAKLCLTVAWIILTVAILFLTGLLLFFLTCLIPSLMQNVGVEMAKHAFPCLWLDLENSLLDLTIDWNDETFSNIIKKLKFQQNSQQYLNYSW